jgi:hypothetical protein
MLHAAAQATQWDRPAAQIAHAIADVLGPAPAHLSVENLSSIPKDAVPAIRRMVEDDLKIEGVNLKNSESGNAIHLTLSENAHGGLWVAEVLTANETRVVMVPADLAPPPGPAIKQKVLLHREVLAKTSEMQWKVSSQQDASGPETLAAAELNGELVLLTAEQVAVFDASPGGWIEQAHADFPAGLAASRDPRGVIVPLSDAGGFNAYAPAVACAGTFSASAAGQAATWTLRCRASDDPWPAVQLGPGVWMKAFYNFGRDFFTGVVTPPSATDLPPFYSAGLLPGRAGGSALLIDGVDGSVQIVENNQLKPVGDTRNWGSEIATLSSVCDDNAQVLVSSAGGGAGDSLRAYEVQVAEALAVSEPLQLTGTTMSLWTAPDGKSAIAIVRAPLPQGQRFDYEVDRVTQSCN